MTAVPDPTDVAALLDFYLASGVDCALGEDPVDRFAESAALAARASARRDSPSAPTPLHTPADTLIDTRAGLPSDPATRERHRARSPAQVRNASARAEPSAAMNATIPGDTAVMAARQTAAQASSLDELREALGRFEGCNLRLTAKSTVFADGNPQARLMFVGEAPGRDEDEQGVPFVGRSGKLLDLMLAAIGLDREAAYIANVVAWRPPGNRTPTPQEAEICKPFIHRQIELADPDVLVFLGGAAAKLLLPDVSDGILKLRGRWFDYDTGTRTIRAIATLHPAYLLRTATQKRLAWRDLLKIKAALEARE